MNQNRVPCAVAVGGPGSGAVAGGSQATAEAGAAALRAGGNAVDAVLAATLAATVAEQAVTSLGGGGFLIVGHPDGDVALRDFFVDTPGRGLPVGELDVHFLPMDVHFPGSVQTFHLGMGSVAVPGLLAGVLAAHEEFARLPLSTLVAPAVGYARNGTPMEPSQQVLGSLIRELVGLSPESRALVERDGKWLVAGDLILNPNLADFLEKLASGEVSSVMSAPFSEPLLEAMTRGGLVTAADLDAYQVIERAPVQVERAGYRMFTNGPPSFGGSIIADTIRTASVVDPGDPASWGRLLRTLAGATARGRGGQPPVAKSGTTHVSAVDSDGMVAALTSSNGVTAGFLVPGTGIQLNNMMGEADLNPDGFHATPPGRRLGSMMSPTVLHRPDGSVAALGTGGSERIRSALTEVMVRMIDVGESLPEAVGGGRIHPNDEGLQVEPLWSQAVLEELARCGLGEVNLWDEPSVFFGGVNAVERFADGSVRAVADGRRGGGAVVCRPE